MVSSLANNRNDVLVITLTGQVYCNMFKKFLTNKNEREEFTHFIIHTLSYKDEDKLVWLYNNNQFNYYLSKIIYNQIKSKTSPWHQKFRIKESFNLVEEIPAIQNTYTDSESHKQDMKVDFVKNIVNKHINKSKDLRRNLEVFKLYYFDNLSLRNISEKLTYGKKKGQKMSHSAARKYLKASYIFIMEQIELELKNNEYDF